MHKVAPIYLTTYETICDFFIAFIYISLSQVKKRLVRVLKYCEKLYLLNISH